MRLYKLIGRRLTSAAIALALENKAAHVRKARDEILYFIVVVHFILYKRTNLI